MFEFHGWAVLRLTPHWDVDLDEEDRIQEAERGLVTGARNRLAQVSAHFSEVTSYNGKDMVTLGGYTSHRQDSVVDFFRWLSQAGPGSYGLLSIHDDEDARTTGTTGVFRHWVLKRGTLTEEEDAFLSPFQPVIEDWPSRHAT